MVKPLEEPDLLRTEYLCRFQEREEMSDQPKYVPGTIEMTHTPTCRHCKKEKGEHTQGKCLFEATTWDPMNLEEWRAWRSSLWVGGMFEEVPGMAIGNLAAIKKIQFK